MKDKYNGVKLERNKAWLKIKELTRSNSLMDSSTYKLQLQLEDLKQMERAELIKLRKDN